jgi:hypothetical protein
MLSAPMAGRFIDAGYENFHVDFVFRYCELFRREAHRRRIDMKFTIAAFGVSRSALPDISMLR